ncbi:hypothetical protein ACVGW0_15815, partial [Enterobacter intestinihominis]
MKRTKTMNHASFRKTWKARHQTPLALAVTGVVMLEGLSFKQKTHPTT